MNFRTVKLKYQVELLLGVIALLIVLQSCVTEPRLPVSVVTDGGWGDTLSVLWVTPKPFNLGQDADATGSSIKLPDSTVIFGFGEGLVRVEENTGKIRWSQSLGINPSGYGKVWDAREMLYSPQTGGGVVYAIAGNDAVRGAKASVVCVAVADGHLYWRWDLAPEHWFAKRFNASCQSDAAIFVTDAATHVVTALAKSDGHVLWQTDSILPFPAPGAQGEPRTDLAMPCYRNGVVYVGSGISPARPGMIEDGGLVALDASTGRVIWKELIPIPDSTTGHSNPSLLNYGAIQSPGTATDRGVIEEAGFCMALIDSTGKTLWQRAPSVNGGLTPYGSPPTLHDGVLYGYNDGAGWAFAFAMDPNSGSTKWVQNLYGKNSATILFWDPVIDRNVTYHVTDAYTLIGQDLATGAVTWRSELIPYFNLGNDVFSGSFTVDGDLIFYQGTNHILCLSRRKQ